MNVHGFNANLSLIYNQKAEHYILGNANLKESLAFKLQQFINTEIWAGSFSFSIFNCK